MSLEKDRISHASDSEIPHVSLHDVSSVPLQELEAQLKTDFKVGLHPKEATARGSTTPRDATACQPRVGHCIKAAVSEPVMLLYLVLCIVAVFFDRRAMGIFSALLMLLHMTVRIFLDWQAMRLEHRMRMYDVPLTRVLRNQRLMRIRGDQLAVGDVILLRRGDVIPCDLRLITSRGLVVAEPSLDGDEKKREMLVLEKDANAQPAKLSHRHSPENMLYEGGIVRGGSARAVVVAVGTDTHWGAMKQSASRVDSPSLPPYLANIKKKLSLVNLITAVAVIPVTALGILLVGNRYSFLDIFLAALALSVMSLTEHTLMLGRYGNAAARARAADDADTDNSVEIRTPETLEKLCKMDHLILMGTAALHDGISHPHHVYTCGRMYPLDHDCEDRSAKAFAEKLYLFAQGQNDRLRTGTYRDFPGLDAVSETLAAWAETDTEGALLRLERMEPTENGVRIKLRGRPMEILYVTDDPEDIAYCHTYRTDVGEAPLDDAALESWTELYASAHDCGYRSRFLISENDGSRCLEGYLAMAVGDCRKTAGIITAMEDSGVRVLSFLRDVYPEDEKALSDAGFFKKYTCLDLQNATGRLRMRRALEGGVRCFLHCRTEDVLDAIDELKHTGATVGVLSVERVDLAILKEADVAFTCTPSALKDVLQKAEPCLLGAEATSPDGHPDSACASDLCRKNAHVILRRCGTQGGGLCGVRRARLAAGQLARGFTASVRFLMLSQITRILLFFLTVVTGTACIFAPLLLASGLLADGIALYVYTQSDLPKDGELTGAMRPLAAMRAPHRYFAVESIITAASCMVPAVIAAVTYWTSGSERGNMAYFVALSLILTQVVLVFTAHLPRRRRYGFFLPVLLICIYAGILSLALASKVHVIWCLLLPLAQPLAWLAGYIACRLLHRIPPMP